MIRANGVTAPVLAMLVWMASPAAADAKDRRCVTDDADRRVCLDAPAQRIVSLSPGATELLFAAGAGDRVVGTVTHSRYPEQARNIPRVGDYKRLDMESLLAARPDLVVGWISGNPTSQLERLQTLDTALYLSEPRALDDVATTLQRLGRLAGTGDSAESAAADFRADIRELGQRHGRAEPVTVFYQIWADPLMTVNNDHLISQVIRLCGGRNVFGELDNLTPRIDREVVLERDPEAIVAAGMGEDDQRWLTPWRRFDHLRAVQRDNLFMVPPSTIQLPTPRLVKGARLLCRQLEQARERR